MLAKIHNEETLLLRRCERYFSSFRRVCTIRKKENAQEKSKVFEEKKIQEIILYHSTYCCLCASRPSAPHPFRNVWVILQWHQLTLSNTQSVELTERRSVVPVPVWTRWSLARSPPDIDSAFGRVAASKSIGPWFKPGTSDLILLLDIV